jgi:hypothetical protein
VSGVLLLFVEPDEFEELDDPDDGVVVELVAA